MTEWELIEQLKLKDERAFKTIVDTWQDMVYNTVLGIVQNAQDAEDVSQEVFIQVYESIQNFKGDSKFSTWIYRIAVTKSLDLLRRKKRKKRFGFVSSLFGADNTPIHEPEEFNHPGVQLDRKEDAALLFKLVDQLPGNQRTAFILNKVEELSYREIAAILDTSEPAVDSLLQRAKQNLRKKINELPP